MTDTIVIQGKVLIVMTQEELDFLLHQAKDEGAVIMRDALYKARVDSAPNRYPDIQQMGDE